MPTLKWNKKKWDGGYNWKGKGEEWSKPWGSSEAQWFGCIYPRIHRYLPARRILEIAPGYGRWTRYLLRYCLEGLHGVDMSGACVEHCREIFADDPKATFSENDGFSLDAVTDGSIDFLFSFDSLVHAEMRVHEAYIPQMLAKLSDGGVAFIHHSNWAAAHELRPNAHARATSVSAELVAGLIGKYHGHVIRQECINWRSDALIDAFTLFSRCERPGEPTGQRIKNHNFMHEAAIIREVFDMYCGKSNRKPSETAQGPQANVEPPASPEGTG